MDPGHKYFIHTHRMNEWRGFVLSASTHLKVFFPHFAFFHCLWCSILEYQTEITPDRKLFLYNQGTNFRFSVSTFAQLFLSVLYSRALFCVLEIQVKYRAIKPKRAVSYSSRLRTGWSKIDHAPSSLWPLRKGGLGFTPQHCRKSPPTTMFRLVPGARVRCPGTKSERGLSFFLFFSYYLSLSGPKTFNVFSSNVKFKQWKLIFKISFNRNGKKITVSRKSQNVNH